MHDVLPRDSACSLAAGGDGAARAPSIAGLREVLTAYCERSTRLAVGLLLVDLGLFAGGQWLVVAGAGVGWQLAGGMLTTLAIVRLFIIGHDACHGSLTDYPRLNKLLGRIAFLPSLTPFSLWRVGHNVVHHGFNNLKGRDFVWQPFDPAEFAALTPARRRLERIYRSAVGPLPYYLVEIWWRRLYFPGPANAPGQRAEFLWDCVLVSVFVAGWIAWLVSGRLSGGGGAVAVALVVGVLLPFLVWNWVVGFVVYLHHTHPSVIWYADKSAWVAARGILQGTVRYRVRPWWNWLLHNIMEHGAHHLDPRIPLYRLKAAQSALARLLPDIPVVELSLRTYWRSVRACKLFDFEGRRWVGFPEPVPSEA
jgi:acyl-lipid omega-6 desaturase (Delta-12 desaturase)